MELTNSHRFAKLTANLLRQPWNLPRYALHNLVLRQPPLDLELPWFSYGAIDFLHRTLRPQATVFEFGSGGSTVFFARHCASVTCVEDNPAWAARVRERAAALGLTNATIRDRPVNVDDAAEFLQSEYLNEVRRGRFDVIVVDGADNDYTVRPVCFRVAEEQVLPGGMIIVDDSWRYTALRENHRARTVRVFESVGPARFGVTSTDVYFY